MKKTFTQLSLTLLLLIGQAGIYADTELDLSSTPQVNNTYTHKQTGTSTEVPGKIVTAQQLQEAYPYAFASYLSYRFKTDSSDIEANEALQARMEKSQFINATAKDVPSQWVKSGVFQTAGNANRIYDRKDSGLKARVFINHDQKKIIMAFTGTEFDSINSMMNALHVHSGTGYGYVTQYLSQWFTNYGYAPYENPMLRKALVYTMDVLEHYPDYQVDVTGSSLGGAIAQFVALSLELKAYVFNSLSLADATYSQMQIDNPSMLPPDKLITHFYVEGEFLNNALLSGMLHIPYLFGAMPVEGTKLPVPKEMGSLHGYGQAWTRHGAKAILNVVESHMEHSLPALK